ncbi:antibiotic biosynthesis monooxygenase [Streptomyces sp. E11-3]|uniref:putative quinol monooxygenase n=1 Tax=Streptomyces sp. E11-3 TaxID=3110112 RepID=UPI0039813F21
MLIISGTLYVDPDSRERYLAGCRPIVEQARAAAGCLDFALCADLVDPGRINVYERWESDAALEKFRGSGPSSEQTAELIEADVRKYRISGVEAP